MQKFNHVASTLLLSAAFVAYVGEAKAFQQSGSREAAQANNPAMARLAKEVRHELVMLPYYGVFDDLAFRIDGRTVTLLGQVTRPTLKTSAGNVVKGIEGVESVNNQIEVLPLSPNDDRIRRAVYNAIYSAPTLSTRYGFQAVPPIHIIVKNGNLTLTGVVANEMDKTVANTQARGVPGVFSVTNNLRVEK